MQADRCLDKRKADPKLAIDDKWDDAVKTLLNYPEVVKMMSNDLDWTSALGEAVVADQGAVLEGVQSFRRRAQAAGNLKSDDKQVVKAEKEIIIIQPANPQVIYVPQYTPSTVITYGVAPVYGYYPAPYPSYYYPYPPGAALAAGVIWGAAIGAAWNGGHWGANYGGGDINIDIDRNTNINRGDRGNAAQRPAGGSGSTAWKSNKQPGQVSSSVGKTPASTRVGDARGGAGAGGYGSAGAGGAGRRRNPAAAQRARALAHRSSRAVVHRVAVPLGPRPSPRAAGSAVAVLRGRRHNRPAAMGRQQRQPGRRRLRRLQLGAADADGQLARCLEPQLDVRRRCSPGAERWWCPWRRWWPRRRWSSLTAGATTCTHPLQSIVRFPP